ncbi:MAG TPA: DoxX family protein [Pirellulaceae bacterium]|nr:DoxX family protein [Pirellulaceae bacterium]
MLGLHFLVEGITKLQDDKPFTAPFFSSARGPLAPAFKRMVWDADGLWRLNKDATVAHWDSYKNRVVRHYGFDDAQAKEADSVLKAYKDRLEWFLNDKGAAITEYHNQLHRRDENAKNDTRQLASLQVHDTRIASETKKLYVELIPPIDGLWRDLENDLNAIATPDQWKRHGRLAIGKIGRGFPDSETLDAVMPYFDVVVGICLIVGLFTRPAAILAAMFLATVFLSHFPPEPGPGSTYYHLVEMFALFAIAAVGGGRYLGLDYFLGLICCRGKKTGETK